MSKHEHTTRWLTATLALVMLTAGLLLLPPTQAAASTVTLTAFKPTDTSVQLKWSLSLSAGVILNGYSISWGKVGDDTSYTKNVYKVTTSNLSGLTPRTEYWFQINAKLIPGSVTSNKVTVSTNGLIVAAVSHSNVSLQWVENYSGEFGIERKPASTGVFVQINTTAAGTATYSDASVSASTAYLYRVSYYAAGKMVYTNTVTVTTPAAPPPVVTLSVTRVTDTSVQLKWSLSLSAGVILKGYSIAWGKVGDDTTYTESANRVTLSTLGGLTPRTEYWFQINATLTPGSVTSNKVVVSTTGLIVAAFSHSNVSLQWADSSSNETLLKVERAPASTGVFVQINTTAAGTATYSDASVSASTAYRYRVSYYAADTDTAYDTNTVTVTTLAAPPPVTIPAAPTELTATVAESNVNLRWVDNSSNETLFRIKRTLASTGSFVQIDTDGASSAGYATYADATVSASTAYLYQVLASNSAGNSAYSNTVTVTTPAPPPTKPAAPTGLVLKANAYNKVDLQWTDNSSDETVFKIERAPASTGVFVQINTTGAGSATYSDATVSASTAYLYRVRAYNLAGDSGYSNTLPVTTPAAPPTKPAAPTGLVLKANAYNKVDLQWADNSSDETVFKIERAPASTGVFVQIDTTAAGTATYSDATVSASTAYLYRVRAYNLAGDSGYSNTLAVTTPAAPPTKPVAPTNLAVTANAYNKVDLQWADNSTDETLFKIERAPASTGVFVQIDTTAAGTATYSDTTVSASTAYLYRVRAYNLAGDSGYSNTLPVTTPAPPATKPVAPTGLVLKAAAYNKVDLQWTDNSSDETGFKIERAPASTGVFVQIDTTGAGTATCSDATVSASTAYLYRVRAYNTAGDSDYSNTLPVTTPAAPAGVAPIDPHWIAKTPIIGEGYRVAMSGQYAYVASSTGLQVVDISRPTEPVITGSVDLTSAYEVATDGAGYVYVGDGKSLKVVDAQDPTAPIVVAAVEMPDYVFGICVSGGKAYIADYLAGLVVVDVTNRLSPVKLGALDTSGQANSVSVEGTLAIVADGSGGLLSVNVSNPRMPALAGTLATADYALDVELRNGTAYVAARTAGILTVDCRNALSLAVLGQAGTVGSASGICLSESGSHAYVADSSNNLNANGLEIIDVSDASKPSRLSFLAAKGLIRGGVAASGDTVLLAARTSGLNVISAANPTAPTMIGALAQVSRSNNVAASGNLLYATSQSALYAFDIANPSKPITLGYLPVTSPSDIALDGSGYLYVGDGKNLRVVDVSDPSHLAVVAALSMPDYVFGVTVSGNRVYVACYLAGLVIVDCTNPLSLVKLGTVDTPGQAFAVSVTGNIAAIADGTGGLRVADVANCSQPVLIGSYATTHNAFDVACDADCVYLAANSSGLHVLSLVNPRSPQLLGQIATRGSAQGVCLSGQYAFVACSSYSVLANGLEVIDVSSKSSPTELTFLPSGVFSRAVATTGNCVFVTDDRGLVNIGQF